MLQSHWRNSVSLSNSRILEGDLIRPTGQYCCPFTFSVCSTVFFLSLSLVDSPHFFWRSIKSCFYSICWKPTDINKVAEILPCNLAVSGVSSTDVVEFRGDVMFWKSSLFWCLLLVETSAYETHWIKGKVPLLLGFLLWLVLVEYAAASNALRFNSDKVDHERGIKWLHAMCAIVKRAKQDDSFITCLVDDFSTFRACGMSIQTGLFPLEFANWTKIIKWFRKRFVRP